MQMSKSNTLQGNPQMRGTVKRIRICTPRKPNSARRQVAKIFLRSMRHTVAYLPGIGHSLRKHSAIIIRGRGARDLPGIHHSCIRGVKDFLGVRGKTKRRSIYGLKIPKNVFKKARRKIRKMLNMI